MSLADGKDMKFARIAFLVIFIFFLPSMARAHALLVDSSPKNDSVLVRAPNQAILNFNARIEKNVSQAELVAGTGRRVRLTRLSNDQKIMDQLVFALPPLSSGSYRIEYRVLASDGHATPGLIRFSVAGAEGR